MASTAPPFFLAQFPTIPFPLQVVLPQPANSHLHSSIPYFPISSSPTSFRAKAPCFQINLPETIISHLLEPFPWASMIDTDE
ncbi:hypothetical protein SLEP1_g56323 [Rubroshorea leprosula]|uniref:Uncharacterized protein n=1 Tax=Rubroshorea leprosula TaxID=152421 RepID=A0AAV5MI03_9ROSI|nr:hypothetical protein SLEP1_g56323 [Rubroshorea leprosula]